MNKNIPIKLVAFEMLQELSKKHRKKPNEIVEELIKEQYLKLWHPTLLNRVSIMDNINLYEDSEGGSKNKKTSKADVVKRMVASYRRRKREEKIQKLVDNGDHWRGLE